MFDTITCEYPLPLPEFQKEEFQTKDLDNVMSHYNIDTSGQLWNEKVTYDLIPEEERDKSMPFSPVMKQVAAEWVKCDITEYIQFYFYRNNRHVEFKAHFRKGVLKEIWVTHDEIDGWLHVDHPEVPDDNS